MTKQCLQVFEYFQYRLLLRILSVMGGGGGVVYLFIYFSKSK